MGSEAEALGPGRLIMPVGLRWGPARRISAKDKDTSCVAEEQMNLSEVSGYVLSAVGLTVYFLAQYMVLNYVRKFNHVKPLWFANVANNILWWTFVKACWRAVGSTMGKGITFKTTLKGRGMLIANSIGDLWMPTLCFLGLLASLGKAFPPVRQVLPFLLGLSK